MANVKVINILPENEILLSFLFPEYAVVDSAAVTSKFITHRTVRSCAEREVLDLHYSDGIFISTQIFDELWDEQRLSQECIEFSRVRFKNRKKTLPYNKDTFVQDCINFIFGIPSIEEESTVTDLFDSFGSASFPVKYFNVTQHIPYQQVVAALTTFVTKLNKDSTSVYYKKKAMLLEDKIHSNMLSAIDAYNSSLHDESGVSECKLFMDLYK